MKKNFRFMVSMPARGFAASVPGAAAEKRCPGHIPAMKDGSSPMECMCFKPAFCATTAGTAPPVRFFPYGRIRDRHRRTGHKTRRAGQSPPPPCSPAGMPMRYSTDRVARPDGRRPGCLRRPGPAVCPDGRRPGRSRATLSNRPPMTYPHRMHRTLSGVFCVSAAR